jgi:hypothetical protein
MSSAEHEASSEPRRARAARGTGARPAPDTPTTTGRVARLFGLKGESWMRHANPLSVWTRFSVLSLIALSVWSRDWIGWLCVIPIGLSLVWMMVNPLLFPPPRSTRNWASKGVLGERIWAERGRVELPPQFTTTVPNVANVYAGLGLGLLAYGLVDLRLVPVLAGLVIAHGGKLWYLDRMVLLFEDMKSRDAEYARWEF